MGIGEAFEAMEEFRRESLGALEADIQAGIASEGAFAERLDRSVVRHGLAEKRDVAVGKFLGLDLFDLQKITNLPIELLNDFAWSPGQETDFLSAGNFKGWPLRIWPTFKRPFLKVGERYYCFDQTVLFDHFFRQLEKRVYQVDEATKQAWIATRKDVTERLPFEYRLEHRVGLERLDDKPVHATGQRGLDGGRVERAGDHEDQRLGQVRAQLLNGRSAPYSTGRAKSRLRPQSLP
jgi:hypothetical protein